VTDQARLPMGSRVHTIGPAPYLSKDERAELLASCPHPYDQTLDAIIAIGYKTGRCYAGLEKIQAKAKLSRRTVLRHRAWLTKAGYLILQGGGHRGRNASFVIARPSEMRPSAPPPAWARIVDPELRAAALEMDL
jgi:hypothetical protein